MLIEESGDLDDFFNPISFRVEDALVEGDFYDELRFEA